MKKQNAADKDANAPKNLPSSENPPAGMPALPGKPPTLKPSFLLSSRETGRVLTSVESSAPHLGWRSRGYLPHWDHPGMIQSLNFRLTDSLPQSMVAKWQNELAVSSQADSLRASELQQRVEKYLDAGHGECWLKRPDMAQLVEDALLHFDSQRYHMLAWCIMPNHVHALIEALEGYPLGEILHAWKSFTGSQANKILNRRGVFWQREYLDRYIRNAEHYRTVIAYIEENPVKAGLVKIKTEWPWSSARFRTPGSAGILPASQTNHTNQVTGSAGILPAS